MKRLLLLISFGIIAMISSNKSFAQSTLFNYDSVLLYLGATSEPDANWYKPDFDDSGWTTDTAAIGFGENLYPVNPAAKSIYARFDFNIVQKDAVKALNLFIDYDDGYIAYLNGHEIARVNVNKSVKFPAFDALATRSHEAELIRNYTNPIEGIYLDSTLLNTCLVNGKNIVAVHVLNDSVNGSDMVFIPMLYNIIGNYYNTYSTVCRFKRLIDIDSASLPLVIINTDEFGIPSLRNAPRIEAFMGIIDNGQGKYNHPDDEFNVYEGKIDIEVRGQSSNDFPKQSYRFELKEPDGGDTSVVLLGMPKDDDWILFGPFADRSQIRNKLMFDLGRQLGRYQPRTRFCELILNGQSVGLYALTESIKRGPDRVDIAKLKNTDVNGIDVTGGYIFKYDKESTSNRTLVYPKADSIQPEQKAYFDNFMKSYDSIFTSNKFINPGFRKYADDTSLIDYIIMCELVKNADSYLFSTYCYKDREDKDNRVKFGPLWDYDLGFGNTHFQDGHIINGWQWDINGRLGVRRFLQDSAFVDFLQERYYSLRQTILSNDYIFATIDSMVNYIDQSRERNYQIWPVIDKNPWSNNQTYMVKNYDEEIDYMKNWIVERTNWMDANMDKVYYPLKIYTSIETYALVNTLDCKAYPNPFADQLTLTINSNELADVNVEITNLIGQKIFSRELGTINGYQEINLSGVEFNDMPTGVYFLKVYADNMLDKTIKIIKN